MYHGRSVFLVGKYHFIQRELVCCSDTLGAVRHSYPNVDLSADADDKREASCRAPSEHSLVVLCSAGNH